ncbi:MAG: hypothetical protein KGH53_01295 [Candidatus Micrarchaeota archaeon]|nr:hypothetical protein [Candidatus Micrarchaeota archaeon]
MALQAKRNSNAQSIYTDSEAAKIARSLTSPQIFTIYYLKGLSSRLAIPTLSSLKAELKSHGHDEKEYTQIVNFLESKSLIERNGDIIILTGSFAAVNEKLKALSSHKREH